MLRFKLLTLNYFSHYNEVLFTFQHKHHSIFDNYQSTTQLLNGDKVDLFTNYI
jgi:hypothetical protein